MRSRKRRPLRYRGLNIGGAGERTLHPGAPLAPWWRRAVALTLDSAVLIGVTEGTFAALEGDSYLGKHNGGDRPLIWLAIILTTATLYYAIVMRASDGQTLGKWLLGIRVVRTDGAAMSATRAIWRQVVLLILLPDAAAELGPYASAIASFVLFIDYLWPLWDRENRALHDMLAGTRVRMVRVPLAEVQASSASSGAS
jgi:uncharacterized RDD family membrane protein YckC